MTLNDGYAYTSHIQRGGVNVLDFLSGEFRHSSREVWAARLATGEIELDGRSLRANVRLRAGQQLVWHRPPWREETVPLSFEVLFEDADLLAVSKPAGLPTVPGGGFLNHTLLSAVRGRWPTASPLHRLGRGTSGLVLCSLTSRAGAALLADWRAQRVQKVYLALASGVAAQDVFEIRTPIGPVPHAKLGEVFAASPAGKAARSVARVLERRQDSTLFEVEIFTGRPHQIRIHLASIGQPLVGDPLYVPGGSPLPEALPGDVGYHLHAWKLTFTHPASGKAMTLTAPPPAILEHES
ncbi:RluA family pseudouridine synthase [Deinococcus fonticola]|uniref:RluA family pseudouridine synthase n=1 Tax=Deinococcus fonticola TaxID=2528713 RepID=UPI001074E7AA|nr:RluA family pseudouridine synthase [Deinococcus fonticola]